MRRTTFVQILLLLTAVVLGTVLRFWQLGAAPKGALVDEAHFGYIAYSLLQTGRDEHSSSWPIIFRGFGDDKLPAYAYSMLPVVAGFGLSTWSIRLPSAIAGSLLPLAAAFLISSLFFSASWKRWAAVLAAGLSALSPWPFFLSRFGLESNLGLLFFTIGLGLLFYGLQSRRYQSWLLGLSGIFLAATWYAYISYRPITFILLIFTLGWQIWSRMQAKSQSQSQAKSQPQFHSTRGTLILIISFVLTVLPLFQPAALSSFTRRFGQVGITSDHGIVLKIDEQRTFCAMQLPLKYCSLLWNKPLEVMTILVTRYIHVFSPQYLATQGEKDTPFLTVEQTGQFFVIAYPLFLLGLVCWLCFPRVLHLSRFSQWFVLLGLVLSPVPTVLAGEAQKVRMSALLPFMIILIVAGAVALSQLALSILRAHGQKLLVVFWIGWWSLYIFLSLRFAIDFIFIHSLKNDYMYQSFLPQTFSYIKSLDSNTSVVIKPFFSDPILFYAYYNILDPRDYQSQAVLGELEASGFQHTVGLGNITVKDISLESVGCEAARSGRRGVFVTNEEWPKADPLQTIRSANGSLRYVYIYDATKYAQQQKACQGS